MVTRKDILEALGVTTTEDRFMSGMLIGVGLGALAGGMAALMLSPRTGPELREQLGTRGRELGERLRRMSREETATSDLVRP